MGLLKGYMLNGFRMALSWSYNKKKGIGTETVVHGQRWGAMYSGYFSDPATAGPLVKTIKNILVKSPADVVVDLGGGTGFLLSQLRAQGIGADTALVNIDCSDAQLALSNKENISSVCTSVDKFRRSDVASKDGRVLFMMRSVLHYFGEDGLSPLLCYLRSQAKAGEFFVHQTASFDNEEEAVCLNALYRHMRTNKWYPTVKDLQRHMTDSRWRVTDTTPARSLLLTSDELGQRYALNTSDIAYIRDIMAKEFGVMKDVFRLMPSGFQANLHYRIYTCEAVSA